MKPKYKVYDSVWVMRNERPRELLVFAVIESMDFAKTGTEYFYHLVESTIGAGWGNNSGEQFQEDNIFADKNALIQEISK